MSEEQFDPVIMQVLIDKMSGNDNFDWPLKWLRDFAAQRERAREDIEWARIIEEREGEA